MHAALKHFFERLPAEVGTDSVVPELLEQAQELLVRAVDLAVDALSLPPASLAVAELRHGLRRQLASFVRSEAELRHRFQPRYLEKSFGPARARRLRGDRPDRPHRRRSDCRRAA